MAEKLKIEEEMNMIPNFMALYESATSEKYSFLYVDLRNMRVYKRFEELMWEKI